ncbi:uncharacterized protein BJ171DRAFT_606112 [Polychytrium aggregatum]|uniref:uncharacterized protein n=1 Tax=Polychytrium aggregatum TaxID=110093 RepID=UPI0022FE4177|nr:uncharacterized protein BJ171DRAFT_606112 [Polychytrium aggregatum]KAI9190797.1 hypothetical protein BJ171DRAFT_606112 [Polychytrium aggregatum]
MASKISKVVSVLPSATEMLCLIGGERLMVGRSHEDDYPASITHLPILTGQKTSFTSSKEVDEQVKEFLSQGQSLYTLNVDLLKQLHPQVILTQDLCNVCAIDLVTVQRVAKSLSPSPQVVTLNPFSLQDVLDNILEVGKACDLLDNAQEAVAKLDARATRARELAAKFLQESGGVRRNVAFIEWTDPIYMGGHWTPQLIHWAGAAHPLSPPKDDNNGSGPSFGMEFETLSSSQPEIVIIAPCGLDLAATRKEAQILSKSDWWKAIMVKKPKIALVDGNQMFNRPGPRLVDALEWLVGFFWDRPDLIPPDFPWEKWDGETF